MVVFLQHSKAASTCIFYEAMLSEFQKRLGKATFGYVDVTDAIDDTPIGCMYTENSLHGTKLLV